MINLDEIIGRCEEVDRLKETHPWTWREGFEQTAAALRDRTNLVAEVMRLRKLVPDAGLLRRLAEHAYVYSIDLPGQFAASVAEMCADSEAAKALAGEIEEAAALQDVLEDTTPVEHCERLRALIPDVWMLDWLVKAAVRWWKDNGGEGTQKDIAAGYALIEKLFAEMNIDET